MNNLQNFRTMSKDKMHLTVALDSIESLSTLVKGRIVEAKSEEDYKSICLDVLESLAIIPTIIDTSDGIINQTDAYIEKLKESHNKEIIGITKNITDSAERINTPKASAEDIENFAASFATHLNLVDASNPNNIGNIIGSISDEAAKFESRVTMFCQSIPRWETFSNEKRAIVRREARPLVRQYNVTSLKELEKKAIVEITELFGGIPTLE